GASGGDLPCIGKQEPPQGAVTRSAREWQIQLYITHDTAGSAKVIVSKGVTASKRCTLVASYRSDTAAINVLYDREGFSAKRFTIAREAIESQGVRFAQGQIVLLLRAEHVVA